MKKIYFLFLTMLLTLISCEEEKSPIQIAMVSLKKTAM